MLGNLGIGMSDELSLHRRTSSDLVDILDETTLERLQEVARSLRN